jgi:hypothetical protein
MFYVLRNFLDDDFVLGLPWLDDGQASLQFDTTRVFTLMDRIAVETPNEEHRSKCLLMSSNKVQKLMRKTRQSRGCNTEIYVIDIMPAAEQPTEFHIGEELTAK